MSLFLPPGLLSRTALASTTLCQSSPLVSLGEWVSDGEVDQEPGLSQQTPAIDVDLGAWCGWRRELWDDLLSAGLVSSTLGGAGKDGAACAVCSVECASDFARARV